MPEDPPKPTAQTVALASSRDLPLAEQMELARHEEYEVLEALALNPHAHEATLRVLADNGALWPVLIKNKRLPEDVLELILIANDPEVSPAAVLRHPNATFVMRQMELARQQNEDAPDPQTSKHTSPATVPTYDVDAWMQGSTIAAENWLWNKHDWYANMYALAEPDAESLQREWMLEEWTANLTFTPDYVLARIASKLLERLTHQRPLGSEYAHVEQVAADLAASDITPAIYRVLAAVARHPHTPAVTLKHLASSEDRELSELVAMSGNTNLPVLKAILRRDGTAKAVAQHASPKVRRLFKALKEVLDPQGLVILATNPYLRSMDLEDLEGMTSPAVQAALASNPAYYQDRVDRLAKSDNLALRTGAASNPEAWTSTLHRLSADPEDLVVQTVAANPGAPPEVLTQLFTTRPDTHENLAGNPTTPGEILHALHQTGAVTLDRALARNPSTPAKVLTQLAASPDTEVQWRVANNPSTPGEALTTIQEGGRNWAVRFAARRRILNDQGALDASPPLDTFREAITTITEREPDGGR